MMGFVNEKINDGKRQTIDKDRNIVLHETYWGGSDPYAQFELISKKYKINFEADWSTESLISEKKMIVKWHVTKINGGGMYKKKNSEIIDLIAEALGARGLTGKTDVLDKTIVTFEPHLKGE